MEAHGPVGALTDQRLLKQKLEALRRVTDENERFLVEQRKRMEKMRERYG